jgi:hypothetical protein
MNTVSMAGVAVEQDSIHINYLQTPSYANLKYKVRSNLRDLWNQLKK